MGKTTLIEGIRGKPTLDWFGEKSVDVPVQSEYIGDEERGSDAAFVEQSVHVVLR
jgi:hypothetical protein